MQLAETGTLDQYRRYHPSARAVAATASDARDMVEKALLMAVVCAFWGVVLFMAILAAVR
jgi:hypothetical protein